MQGLIGKTAWVAVAAALVTTVALAALPLSGAIFTTTVEGVVVNGSRYENKEDVYLAGGSGPNAPSHAVGLPAGDYYFQVTDPSGKELLSTDHISCRRVRINEHGVIDKVYVGTNYEKQKGDLVAVSCKHAQGVNLSHAELGAITVQLVPYDDTPNPGGVYKAWITRVEDFAGEWGDDYVPAGGKDKIPVNGENYKPANYHGFVPARSRIATFKVRLRRRTVEPAEVTVRKFHDSNVNGVWDADEAEITGWRIDVLDPLSVQSTVYTKALLLAEPAGLWTITEATPAGTAQTVSLLDGTVVSKRPTANASVLVDVKGDAGETHEVVFGNVGLGTIKACKVYDRDADGVADAGEPVVEGWRMQVSGTDVTGAAYGPVVRTTAADGCATFANLLPGTYTVTELMPTGSTWVASGLTTQTVKITSSLDASGSTTSPVLVTFTNYCKGTADFGTKGYWHNKNGLDEIVAADVDYVNGLAPYSAASSYFGAGDEPFDGEYTDGTDVAAAKGIAGEDLAPAGSDLAEISAFLIDANTGGDAREQLAQQLLAFIFNSRHRLDDMRALVTLSDGTLVAASTLIADAIDAWKDGTDAERDSIKTTLDNLNNSDALPFIYYYACAVTYN
jgi:hypothetical protein